jgi:hypothetical protein
LTARIACTSGAGAVIQPTFQPVVLNVLPPLEIDTVRSRAPRRVAIGTCGSLNVRCSYTSSVTMSASFAVASSTMRWSVSRGKTDPVGLCGSLTRMRRVRSAQRVRAGSTSWSLTTSGSIDSPAMISLEPLDGVRPRSSATQHHAPRRTIGCRKGHGRDRDHERRWPTSTNAHPPRPRFEHVPVAVKQRAPTHERVP